MATAISEHMKEQWKEVVQALKEEQGQQVEGSDSDSDESTCTSDNVKVDIAIVGNAGSGRSYFVNVILGLKENDKSAARTPNGKETFAFSHPTYPNIIFSILPNIDQKTFSNLKEFVECTNIEKFDAFLIFTAEMFDNRNLSFAKLVKSKTKPVFFVRTQLDSNSDPEGGKEKCKDETALHQELRTSFAERVKRFHFNENEFFIISTHDPVKWDFLKLTEAIGAALPSQKGCFTKIPIVQKLIALKTFQNYLEEENLRREDIPNYQEIKELFLHSGIAGVQRMMNKMLVQWKEVKVELAVLGNSGAGKSSFVNAIRGVQDGDENAAKTGITETTRVPTAFPHPVNPNIRFWDLPGIGTPNYPDLHTFCKLVRIERYDTFLILSSTRFTENDKLLAAKVKSMGKSFFFIRSKIDNDRRAERRKKGFSEERMLRMIRDDCIKSIQGFDVKEKNIFLISSFVPAKWDFHRLQKEILNRLPIKQKESLMFTLRTTSKDVLKEKIKHLKARSWMVSTSTVLKKFGFWPFSHYVHRDRLRKIIESYTLQLQFPNRDSDEFKMLSEDLQKKVRKFNDEPYIDILQWLKSFDQDNMYDVKINKKYIIAKKPLVFVQYVLNLCIDEMVEIACAILDAAAKKALDDD